MSDISAIKIPNGSIYNIKDSTARSTAGSDFLYGENYTYTRNYGEDGYTVPADGYYSFEAIAHTFGISGTQWGQLAIAVAISGANAVIANTSFVSSENDIHVRARSGVVHLKKNTYVSLIKTQCASGAYTGDTQGIFAYKWTKV